MLARKCILMNKIIFFDNNFKESEYNISNKVWVERKLFIHQLYTQITKFMGPTWGPPGSCWPQIGPVSAPWTLLSGYVQMRGKKRGPMPNRYADIGLFYLVPLARIAHLWKKLKIHSRVSSVYLIEQTTKLSHANIDFSEWSSGAIRYHFFRNIK